ncbi:MAG: hypothetical protein AAGF87_11510 [Bacteroidota bacterium]
MSLAILKASKTILILTLLFAGLSSCGNDGETEERTTSTTEAQPTTEEPQATTNDGPVGERSVEEIQAEKAKLVAPEPEIDANQAFARLGEVVDLTDEQMAQIEAVYAELQLPEGATLLEIQNRNRELRERVYDTILTDGQRETIRAARRSRRSGN